MDLDIGHNCDVSSCHQKDFLPFTCDLCKRKLCLIHRSYPAHNCEGCDSKDINSIDCPMCGKCVKFSKAQRVDEVWEVHYLNNCSHEPDKKAVEVCAKEGCSTVLGLSNAFRCPKCHKDVCLTHRNQEEHMCQNSRNKSVLLNPKNDKNSKFLDLTKEPTVNPTKSQPTKSKVPPKPPISVQNTLKGSTERRNQTSSTKMEELQCPLCKYATVHAVQLQEHFSTLHPDPAIPVQSNPGSTYPGSAYAGSTHPVPIAPSSIETCPTCQRSFSDVNSLVAHCERDHRSSSTSHTNKKEWWKIW
mmetsp:Transcript_14393/g.13882  ORF Transcript_14393/g.13882 Transcript_14393/m.13882 type:complete len:301 (+) Transcript_14393:342-1244(+)